jgi:hypothetical protein
MPRDVVDDHWFGIGQKAQISAPAFAAAMPSQFASSV